MVFFFKYTIGKITSLYGKTRRPSCSGILLMSFCSWLTYWVSAHITPMSCCLTPAAALRRLTSLSNCFILKMMIFWIFLKCRVILPNGVFYCSGKVEEILSSLGDHQRSLSGHQNCGLRLFPVPAFYTKFTGTADATHVSLFTSKPSSRWGRKHLMGVNIPQT